MSRLTIIAALFFLTITLQAQTTISGLVKDNKGRPVPATSISIKDSYDGSTSDSLGNYKFTTTEKGEHLLIFTSIGFKIFEQKINIAGDHLKIDVVLKEEANELTAVVITAGTFEASDRKRAATILNPIDIVTTASGEGDVTGALKTLPGAQQVGESEGLFVRGGTAAETRTFIDGTLVNNFFFSSVPNIAQRSRFSPFLFKGTVFSTGGYSALYGQALSSALILESIDLPEKSSADIGISVIGVNAGYQHLAKNKKSSWGVSYSYANLGLAFKVIKQKQDYFNVPGGHNAEANFRIKTSKSGMLKYYGYFNTGKVGFRTISIDSTSYKDVFRLNNSNMYHNLSYKDNLGKGWKLNAGISYTNNRDDIGSNMQDQNNKDALPSGLEFKQFELDAKGNYFNTKLVIDKRLKGLSAIRFGHEYNYSNDKSDFTTHNGQQFTTSIRENINAVFAEADIYITNNVAGKFGTRFEHSSILNKVNIAPRVSLAYKTGKQSQASLAYGIFYQNPERKYLPATNALTFSRAEHYIAQYQKVSKQITFRAELFYKKYHDLIKTSFMNGRETATGNQGFGDAKGIEFFWRDKKTIKDVDYWISYSYLDTKRDFLNFPHAIQPNFAAKHTASLVLKKFSLPLKTQFNAAYNYASGRPYYLIANNGAGQTKFNDHGKTPVFHNVSFSVNYLPKIGKENAKSFAVYVLSISNIFNIKQVYGYQYSYNGMRKEAIVPPSRIFVYIGAFISFGVDRTQDAIDNNLNIKI